MSPTAFFKLCCVPVSVLKAFFADYMMASVLERRFVNKKRNCCFTPQVLGYAVVLCARLPFVTHENTVYVSIIKLAAYLVAVIFMYKGRVTLRLLMYAIHIFTMFTGEFLSINILGAFGLLYNGFFENNFYLGMLMSELLSSFCVFAVGFAVRRIGKFPTEASSETQFREVSALPITVCFAVVFFCLLQYGFISPGPEVGCISLTLISALAAGIMLQLDVFSKMLKTQQYAADAVADAQRAQLELKKVRAAVSHGEAVQRLEHDMKNLLLLVHMLNERGDSGRIDAVIDRIETEIKAEADGGIQEKEHGACIPIEKFRNWFCGFVCGGCSQRERRICCKQRNETARIPQICRAGRDSRQRGEERGRKSMSSVTFYKICELLLVVIYAFGADYMMTSVLGRRFVPKRKIPFFNFQRLAYILTLATTFLFLSHENTAYTTVYKLVMQFAIVIFMYKGKFALRILMGAAHFFTLFIGEFLSLNAIYTLGIPIERLYVKFSFWVLMCDLLSSLLVFIVGFVAHRIREFPTKSLSSKQLQKLSALPIAAGAAVIVFCLLEYSFISPGLPVGCASLVLIASLAVGITFQLDIFSEMLKTQQHSRAAAASAQEAQFELEKVQETVRHGEDVRRLEHDMKNLLLMIHILNERGDGERIDAMLNDIESKIKVETDSSIAEYGRTVCIPIERFSSYIGSDTGKKSENAGNNTDSTKTEENV